MDMRKLLFLILLVAPASAQQPLRGTFEYSVDGIYEGQSMEPWSATTTVSDTLGTYAIRHVVHRGGGTRFEYTYIPGHEAVWINEGRGGPNNCRSRITHEVADFALPHVIAALSPGETELTVLVCRGGSVTAPMTMKVKVARSEVGLTANGPGGFPFELHMNQDGKVVKYVQPQGTVGLAIYTLQ